jgi:hypothetical protein
MQATKQFICVAIYLKGYELNPEHVTEIVGVQPSQAQKKADLNLNQQDSLQKLECGWLTLKVKRFLLQN